MKIKVYIFFLCIAHVQITQSQVQLSTDAPIVIGYAGTISGVSMGSYTGGGFQPIPFGGKLDSDAWAVTGLSDGDLNFGGVGNTGDFARGTTFMLNPTSDPGATVGGFYSYTGAPFSAANPAFLIQPTDADFSAGTITLKVINTHATNHIYVLDISYDLWIRNNKTSSNKLSFSYSQDNITYTNVPALDYSSPTTSDVLGIVNTGTNFIELITVDVLPGAFIYLRWSMSTVSGSGERDEFYMDEITISAPALLPIELTDFTAQQNDASVQLNWTTLAEIETETFIVERGNASNGNFDEIGQLNAFGNSNETQQYTFTDDAPLLGINYYRLKIIDQNQTFTYSNTLAIDFASDATFNAIYPNPTSDFIIGSTQSTIVSIQLFDVAGNEIPIGENLSTLAVNHFELDVRNLSSGKYFLQIHTLDKNEIISFIKN